MRKREYHRLIWEKHHNACLLPGIHIHHIDGDHSNNDPDNLLACTAEEHWQIHYDQGDTVAINGKFIQNAAKFGKDNAAYKHGKKCKNHNFKCQKCSNRVVVGYSKVCNKCKNIGSGNPRARKVRCTNTNRVWNCIKDMAEDLKLNYNSLRTWVNQGSKGFEYYEV